MPISAPSRALFESRRIQREKKAPVQAHAADRVFAVGWRYPLIACTAVRIFDLFLATRCSLFVRKSP